MARRIAKIPKNRGGELFLGFEHSGLYPLRTDAEAIVTWYRDMLGFTVKEENDSFFLSGAGAGRLEIMKSARGATRVHIAVRVSDFEAAVAFLRTRGIPLKEPMIQPDLKIVYLQQPDPEGNPVHLWWSSQAEKKPETRNRK